MSKRALKIPNEFEIAVSYYNLLGSEYYYNLVLDNHSNNKDDNIANNNDTNKTPVIISMDETKKSNLLCSTSGPYKEDKKDGPNETMIESVMRSVEKCTIA